MERIAIFCPATIGNVGPGFDVLGLAVDGLGDIIRAEYSDGPMIITEITGRDANEVPISPDKNTAAIAAKAFAKEFGLKQGLKISFERGLPVAGGLGSSAAASLGGALAMAYLSGLQDETEDILKAALAGEAKVAGHHLDNIAPCFYGGLTICLAAEPPRVIRVPVKRSWWVALVTPPIRVATKDARAVLPRELPHGEWVSQMAYTSALAAGFALGDEDIIRDALRDPFAEPRRRHLIPGFAEAKAAALKAGAMGCSISGAGPTTFALAETEQLANSAANAMHHIYGDGTTVHVGPIARQGAHLL